MAIQTTTFKGARYLVKFHDPIEWSASESYEAIEAVQYDAYTYISKQPVPAGVQISNTDFWLLWADPNAQMEQLRQLVSQYVDDVEGLSDDVDDLNIELAAEIQNRTNADTEIQNQIGEGFSSEYTVKNAIEEVSEDINSKLEFPINKGIISITAPRQTWGNTNSHKLFYSQDGITFNEVANIPNLIQNSNAITQIGDWFYHTNGNFYRISKDLINWSNDYTIPIEMASLKPNGELWAGSLFELNGNIYFFTAREYKDTDGTYNDQGSVLRYFDIVSVRVSQNQETGVLTLVPNSQQTIISNGSHIDPFAVYNETYGVILACKNEATCKIEIYAGATLNSLSLINATNPLVGVEAPQLVSDDKENVVLYVDAYSPRTVSRTQDGNAIAQAGNQLPQCALKATIIERGNVVNNYLWEVVFYPEEMAHAGYMKVNNDVVKILNEYTIINSTLPKFSKTRMVITPYDGADVIRYYIANIPPFWNYTAGGEPTAQHAIILNAVRIFKQYTKQWLIGVNTQQWLNNNYVYTVENKTKKLVTDNCYEGSVFTMYDTDWGFQFPNVNV